MPASQQKQCYDSRILGRLLNEQLVDEEEATVLAHIETCETCRNAMARLAGDGDLHGEIEQHLAGHSIDEFGAATVIEGEAEHADIEQIKALLNPTDDPQMLGRLGAYEIVGIVGRGSTGVVFKALDKALNRFVAIKMLAPSYAGSGPARKRFEREGRSIAAVRDEHVIPVFSVADHNGLPYIVMEYMPAGSLAQRIEKEGVLGNTKVVRIGMQIASALAAAHKQGVVHRDVKPANVLLADGVDRALVTDFGLARILNEASMTRSGAISGTPQFMSPEQASGSTVGHQSDLFSLGSVMYMACTGHSPFRSETVFGVIKRVCETEPRPIRETNPRARKWLCEFIEKLHAKDPADRFQSAADVADLLAEELAYMQSPTTVSKPTREWRKPAVAAATGKRFGSGKVAAGLACLVIAAWGAFAWNGFSNTDEPLGDAELQPAGQLAEDDMFAVAVAPDSFDEAYELHDAGKYSQAIKFFEKAIQDGERVPTATYNIACAQALLGETDQALVMLQKAIDLGFCDGDYLESDSDLDSLRGDERFKQILFRVEADTALAQKLATAVRLGDQEQFTKAEALYREILKARPNHQRAALELGTMLHMQGKLDEAFPWHQRAAASTDHADLGNYNIACYYSLKNKPAQAFEFLDKTVAAGFDDLSYFDSDSDLDPIRKDVRYEEFIRKTEQALRSEHWSDKEKGCGRLLDAIAADDLEGLKKLLASIGPNCSCPDYRSKPRSIAPPRRTPIGLAAKLGKLDAVKLLASAGADINFTAGGELPPAMLAAENGQLKVVQYMLANGEMLHCNLDGRGTLLTAAASGNHVATMEYLISEGAKVDAKVAGVGTPLLVAAGNGHRESVKLLMTKDVRLNAAIDGVGTALSAAASNGHFSVVEYLISNGADIDTKIDGVGTALIEAIRRDDSSAVKLLLKNNADINVRCDGVGTALSVAAGSGALDVVRLLLDQKANPNLSGDGALTPLADAVCNEHTTVIQLLIKSGADPKLASPGTRSAREIAKARNDKELLKLLRDSAKK